MSGCYSVFCPITCESTHKITHSDDEVLKFEVHPSRCVNMIIAVSTGCLSNLCVGLCCSVDKYELFPNLELHYVKQYSCREVKGVLRGVQHARLVTHYSDKGGRTYKVVIDHMNGCYPLTTSSDNLFIDSKIRVVDEINKRVAASPQSRFALAFASPGIIGVDVMPHQQVMIASQSYAPPPPLAGPPVTSAPPVVESMSWFQSALTGVLTGIQTAQDGMSLLQALESLKGLLGGAPPFELNEGTKLRILGVCNPKGHTPVWTEEAGTVYGSILVMFGKPDPKPDVKT